MQRRPWKQSQTCKVGRRWGWVSYLLPTDEAIVTLEDGGQETVLVGDLEDPTISVGTRTWPSGDVPPSLGDWGMATKPKFSLALAEVTGKSLIQMLADTCERIEMAGSVRRQVFEVGDIELLCVPKAGAVDLFGEPVTSKSMLDLRCRYLIDQGVLAPRPNKVGTVTIGPLNKLLVHPATGIGVDIFATSAENWGMAMVARTGPVGFNVRVMARFRELGLLGHAYGGVTREGEELHCPTEQQVFELLEWDSLEPWRRMNGRVAQ